MAFNKIFKLDKIAKAQIFQTVMRIAVFFNLSNWYTLFLQLVILIFEIFIHDHETRSLFESINSAFIWIYFAEVLINLLGLGLSNYLESTVNK